MCPPVTPEDWSLTVGSQWLGWSHMGPGREGLVPSGSGNSLRIKGFCSRENVFKFWAVQSDWRVSARCPMPILPPPLQLLFDPRNPLGSSPRPGPSAHSACPDSPSLACQYKGLRRGRQCVLPPLLQPLELPAAPSLLCVTLRQSRSSLGSVSSL